MRPKSLILLSLALGCGLVAALGINQMMAKQGPITITSGETREIYVTLKDINTNDLVTAEALKLEPWPKDKVRPDRHRPSWTTSSAAVPAPSSSRASRFAKPSCWRRVTPDWAPPTASPTDSASFPSRSTPSSPAAT